MRPTLPTAACLFSLLWGLADAPASGRAPRGRGTCPCPIIGADRGGDGAFPSPVLPFHVAGIPGSAAPPATALPKVYAVLIMDTTSTDIGASVQQDMSNLQRLLGVLGSRLSLAILSDSDVNRNKILDTLSALSTTVSSQDTVLCYYSGHG